jgi:site-specific DNA-methyltransferase (adenine-specific)
VNTLYYGDNLPILREYIDDESIDLVYLDPPFKSNQDFNVLFMEKDGTQAAAQMLAFEDTWEWNEITSAAYNETVEAGGRVSQVMQSFMTFLGGNDVMAYLAMMAPRLVELRRVLKPTGSIYLHCDPTASHYLKLLMDGVFGPTNFKNEIVWQRTNAHNTAGQYGRIHDILLFYVKSEAYTWNRITTGFSPAQLGRYKEDKDGRLYTGQDLTASRPNSNSGKFEWRGTMPPATRGWGYELEQLEAWWDAGLILTKKDGNPRMDGLKVYLDEKEGKFLQSVWTDITRIPLARSGLAIPLKSQRHY